MPSTDELTVKATLSSEIRIAPLRSTRELGHSFTPLLASSENSRRSDYGFISRGFGRHGGGVTLRRWIMRSWCILGEVEWRAFIPAG